MSTSLVDSDCNIKWPDEGWQFVNLQNDKRAGSTVNNDDQRARCASDAVPPPRIEGSVRLSSSNRLRRCGLVILDHRRGEMLKVKDCWRRRLSVRLVDSGATDVAMPSSMR